MAKKKYHRFKSMTIPLAPIAGLVGMPVIKLIVDDVMSGAIANIPQHIPQIIGIVNGQFNFDIFLRNIVPPVLGLLIHKYVGGTLGLNRMLASAGVPLIRI